MSNQMQHSRDRALLDQRLPEIAAAADWIKLQQPTKVFNLRRTSYSYKHAVEDWLTARGVGMHIPNGAFIAAAIGLGFEAKTPQRVSLNAYFKFSNRRLREFDRVSSRILGASLRTSRQEGN
jgi:hypothetical protein